MLSTSTCYAFKTLVFVLQVQVITCAHIQTVLKELHSQNCSLQTIYGRIFFKRQIVLNKADTIVQNCPKLAQQFLP